MVRVTTVLDLELGQQEAVSHQNDKAQGQGDTHLLGASVERRCSQGQGNDAKGQKRVCERNDLGLHTNLLRKAADEVNRVVVAIGHNVLCLSDDVVHVAGDEHENQHQGSGGPHVSLGKECLELLLEHHHAHHHAHNGENGTTQLVPSEWVVDLEVLARDFADEVSCGHLQVVDLRERKLVVLAANGHILFGRGENPEVGRGRELQSPVSGLGLGEIGDSEEDVVRVGVVSEVRGSQQVEGRAKFLTEMAAKLGGLGGEKHHKVVVSGASHKLLEVLVVESDDTLGSRQGRQIVADKFGVEGRGADRRCQNKEGDNWRENVHFADECVEVYRDVPAVR